MKDLIKDILVPIAYIFVVMLISAAIAFAIIGIPTYFIIQIIEAIKN